MDYDVGQDCPWRRLGVPKLEGPLPTASYVDLRLRKAVSLLQAGLAKDWSAEDAAQATTALRQIRQAHDIICGALPEVFQTRRHSPNQLAPTYAEVSAVLLNHLDELAHRAGETCRLAIMLSNIQRLDLDGARALLPIREARDMYEALVRGPDRGVPELKRLREIPTGPNLHVGAGESSSDGSSPVLLRDSNSSKAPSARSQSHPHVRLAPGHRHTHSP